MRKHIKNGHFLCAAVYLRNKIFRTYKHIEFFCEVVQSILDGERMKYLHTPFYAYIRSCINPNKITALKKAYAFPTNGINHADLDRVN